MLFFFSLTASFSSLRCCALSFACIFHVFYIDTYIQVETVGDKYMAVSGIPEACENHAKWIAKLALDMMDMAKYVQMGTEPVVSQTYTYIQSK